RAQRHREEGAALLHQRDGLVGHKRAMLDRVHPGKDGRLDAVRSVGVGGGLASSLVGFIDTSAKLLIGELLRARLDPRRHHTPGGDQFDAVGACLELLAHGSTHVVWAVCLATKPIAVAAGHADHQVRLGDALIFDTYPRVLQQGVAIGGGEDVASADEKLGHLAMLPSGRGMPGSHWLISLSPENYAITHGMHFSLLGLRTRHRKKAERVAVGDRVLYYVLYERIFPATATVTSAYFEDRHPTWINQERRDDPFPYRVHTQPNLVLEPGEGVDAVRDSGPVVVAGLGIGQVFAEDGDHPARRHAVDGDNASVVGDPFVPAALVFDAGVGRQQPSQLATIHVAPEQRANVRADLW